MLSSSASFASSASSSAFFCLLHHHGFLVDDACCCIGIGCESRPLCSASPWYFALWAAMAVLPSHSVSQSSIIQSSSHPVIQSLPVSPSLSQSPKSPESPKSPPKVTQVSISLPVFLCLSASPPVVRPCAVVEVERRLVVPPDSLTRHSTRWQGSP